jgi:hypothetical protein
MPLSFRRSLPITGVAVVMTGALAMAQTHASPAPRVRPETSETADLFDELVTRSPTARSLAAAINESDLLIYIRHRTFTTATLNGRTGFVRSEGPTRTLIIEVACQRSWVDQMVTLGHELQHAAEIGASTSVVDPRSMARYFDRIGMRLSGPGEAETFETARAQQVSVHIRQELIDNRGRTRTTSHDRD